MSQTRVSSDTAALDLLEWKAAGPQETSILDAEPMTSPRATSEGSRGSS